MINRRRMISIVILLVGSVALLLAGRFGGSDGGGLRVLSPAFPSIGFAAARDRFGLPKEKAAQVEADLQSLDREAWLKRVQESFFDIRLDRFDDRSRATLLVLAKGLDSEDSEVRLTTASLVRSLLIDVAHGTSSPDGEAKAELGVLFKALASKAPEVIAEVKDANPRSPVLAYLDSI